MAKLAMAFFVLLVASLLIAAAARPAPSTGTGVALDRLMPGPSIGHCANLNVEEHWETCMKGVIASYKSSGPCSNMNFIIWRTHDNSGNYQLKSTVSPKVLHTETFSLGGAQFKTECFHSAANFEFVGGYHGWKNWAQWGKFRHMLGSNYVEFFEN